MTKRFLSIAAVLLCTIAAHAQQGVVITPAKQGLKTLTGNPATANKTTAQDSRLIALTERSFSNGSLDIQDSLRCVYNSPGLGYDFQIDDWKYDAATAWKYTAGVYEDYQRYTHTFNFKNFITKTRSEVYDNGVWADDAETLYSYYSNGVVATQQEGYFNGSSWDSTGTLYLYNAQYQLTQQLVKAWNATTSQWDNSYKMTNTYNTDGLITTTLNENWDPGTAAWHNSSQTINTYTNKFLTLSISQHDQNGAWVNGYQSVFTNDPNGNVLTEERQTWDGTAWKPESRLTYTYSTSNEKLTEIYEIYQGGGFGNFLKTTYTYNAYHKVLTEVSEKWDAGTSQFTMQNGDRDTRYYYEDYNNGVKDIAAQNSSMSIYPIPAKDMLHLRAALGKAQPTSVVIVDMSGRMVKHMNLPATAQQDQNIDISNLAPGRYAVTLTSGNTRLVKQVNIVR